MLSEKDVRKALIDFSGWFDIKLLMDENTRRYCMLGKYEEFVTNGPTDFNISEIKGNFYTGR